MLNTRLHWHIWRPDYLNINISPWNVIIYYICKMLMLTRWRNSERNNEITYNWWILWQLSLKKQWFKALACVQVTLVRDTHALTGHRNPTVPHWYIYCSYTATERWNAKLHQTVYAKVRREVREDLCAAISSGSKKNTEGSEKLT